MHKCGAAPSLRYSATTSGGGPYRSTRLLLALEAVKVANRSSTLPLNLLTMKSASGSAGVSSSSSFSGGSSGTFSFTSSDAASLLPPNTKVSYAMEMRSISFTPSIPSSEYFFFGPNEESTYCIMCAEDIEPPFTQRTHVSASSRASHTNHSCREVALDHLALLAIRGYPLDNMYMVWTDVLFQHPALPRIHGLTSPKWTWEDRAAALLPHLKFLCDLKVLDLCLAGVVPQSDTADAYQARRRVAFERVEYIGDCAWGPHIANRLMMLYPNEQWLYSDRVYAFNCTRDAVEMNITLELLFDSLHLTELLPIRCADNVGSGKIKADVVEAVLGELHCVVWGFQPEMIDDAPFVEVNGENEKSLLMLAQHCLTEMYDLLVLGYARELSWNALPLAKVLAAKNLWMETMPALRQNKSGRQHWRRFRGGMATSMGISPYLPSAQSTSPPPHDTAFTTSNATVMNSLNFSFSHTPAPGTSYPSAPGQPLSPTSVVANILANSAFGLMKSGVSSVSTGSSVSPVTESIEQTETELNDEPDAQVEAAETPSSEEMTRKKAESPSDPAPISEGCVKPSAPQSALRRSTGSGQRYVLPAIPRLFDHPQPYPDRVPHPLTQKENLPPLPPSAHVPHSFRSRQRLTTFEYTGKDAFAEYHKSFERLQLLQDSLTHLFPRLEGERLGIALLEYGARLHLSVTNTAGMDVATAPTNVRQLLLDAQKGDPMHTNFFRDPYYGLFSAPEQPRVIEAERTASDAAAPSSPPFSAASKEPGATDIQGVAGSERPEQSSSSYLGLRRGFTIVTPRGPPAIASSLAAAVELATRYAFPSLQEHSTRSEADEDEASLTDANGTALVLNHQWRRSLWVPPGVKPPPAGVVSEQHPLHIGTFAYLAVGVRNPIRTALKRLRDGAKGSMSSANKETDVVTAEGAAISSTLSAASPEEERKENPAAAEPITIATEKPPNGDGPTTRSSTEETVCAAVVEENSDQQPVKDEVAESDEDERVGELQRERAWEFWCQQSMEMWFQENNPYFTPRVRVGGVNNSMLRAKASRLKSIR